MRSKHWIIGLGCILDLQEYGAEGVHREGERIVYAPADLIEETVHGVVDLRLLSWLLGHRNLVE